VGVMSTSALSLSETQAEEERFIREAEDFAVFSLGS
jgi:hypothetical protein